MGAFEVQLRKFAEKAGDNADQIVRQVVIDIHTDLVRNSPVLSGAFRWNWQYGTDRKPLGVLSSSGSPAGPAPEPPPPDVPSRAFGRLHVIANNIPYGPRLETGWSKQAPAGLVAITALKFQRTVDAAVAKVNP